MTDKCFRTDLADMLRHSPSAPHGRQRPGAAPRVREMSFADYDRIATLQTRNGLGAKPRGIWETLWQGNPAFERRKGRWPLGWVLETEGGEIVGSIDNVPLTYYFRGTQLRVASPCSWAVDAGYRTHSISILNQFMRQKEIDLVVCTTVSPAVEPVYSACQMSRVPIGTWNKSDFWITSYHELFKIVLRTKSVYVSSILSYPVAAAVRCADKLKGDGIPADTPRAELELCSEFGQRFDEFWEELKHQNGNILLADRSRETLAWHFRAASPGRNLWILMSSQGARMLAYAIFDRADQPALGLKRVRLIDFQCLDGAGDVLRRALAWMLQKCREEGIHVLEVVGGWLDRPRLRHLPAPHRRTLGSWMYYYKAIDKDVRDTLRDPKVWAPSSFDGDASLCRGPLIPGRVEGVTS
jgi:hypothetical protein